MNNMQIENKLKDLGFVINHTLKIGLNRVGTPDSPKSRNGWIYLKDKFVNYGAWDESIESGYFLINETESIRINNVIRSRAYEEQYRLQQIEKDSQLIAINEWYLSLSRNIGDHPYLNHKKALLDSKLRIDELCNLIIPMFNLQKKLVGAQTISVNHNKLFKPGSILKESFFPILESGKKLEDSNLILLAEGYATSSSIFEAMSSSISGCAVLTCFSVGNIDPVAQALIKLYPDVPILVVKDNDSPGYLPVHMGFTVGRFGEDANDVHCRRGLDELKKELEYNLRFIKIGA